MRQSAPKFACYLIFSKDGISEMRRTRPNLRAGEFAVKIRLQVPPETFSVDLPEAVIDVPAPAIVHPVVTVEAT